MFPCKCVHEEFAFVSWDRPYCDAMHGKLSPIWFHFMMLLGFLLIFEPCLNADVYGGCSNVLVKGSNDIMLARSRRLALELWSQKAV